MATMTDFPQPVVRLPIYFISFLLYSMQTVGLSSESRLMSGCVCPGDTWIYECTVMGPGSMSWRGTAFACANLNNEIILLHSRFYRGAYGTCNSGAIVARSLSVEEDNYTSQLIVTITPITAGSTVECRHDNGIHYIVQRSIVIPSPGPLPPPNKLHASCADLSLQELTFSWRPVAPACPAIHYNILATNCGSCSTITNHTTITCTGVPTDGSMCTFAIQTVFCGYITGNASDSIKVNKAISSTNIAYFISISSLAIALILSIVVSTTVIVITLTRSKAKIKEIQATNRAGSIHMEPAYEDITGPLPSVSTINIRDNAAYGHAKYQ